MEKNKEEKLSLILGSGSPRRKELLSYLNIPFTIITADLEEHSDSTEPSLFAVEISEQKGEAVFDSLEVKENILVISSDTIVVLKDKIYGKPGNREVAKEMLLELSGQTHEVITAVSFFTSEGKYSFFESTKVTFEPIEPELLERYLDTGESLDKAGAYGIQGASLFFISKLEGSYSNVVGFPLDRVLCKLKEKGYWTKLN
jgi:septum formation protein